MKKDSSSKNQRKEEHETQILNLAIPLLQKIYNNFTIDNTVYDRPDKAIKLLKPPARFGKRRSKPPRVGIEITTADPSSYLSYMKDRKKDRETISAQIEEALMTGKAPTQPIKKIANRIYHDWIFEGIKDKSAKHESYTSGEFDEIILLCYSNVLDTTNHIFYDGLIDWTDYLLSINNYPFDKVLFIGANNECMQIYNRIQKRKSKPIEYRYQGDTIVSSSLGMIPMGAPWKYKETELAEPIIKPHVSVVERDTGMKKS